MPDLNRTPNFGEGLWTTAQGHVNLKMIIGSMVYSHKGVNSKNVQYSQGLYNAVLFYRNDSSFKASRYLGGNEGAAYCG